MRIGQFSDSFLPIVDGVGRVVFHYADQLGKKGHECYVMAPMGETGYRGGYPFEIVDFLGLPVQQFRLGIPAEPHYKKRLENINLDIVHVHSPFSAGQSGLAYAKKKNIPVVGTFHSKYYDDFLQATGREVLAELGTKYVVDFYSRCDEMWAVSHASAQTLCDYGYRGEVRVMPNGTEIRPRREEDRLRAAAQFGLDGRPMLLFVGQLNRKKNIMKILEASAQMRAAHRLVLAGQGPHEEEIRTRAEALGLGERIVFTGHIGETALLDGLYQNASLFVFPSVYDNGPMVVREAAAMGVPSVVVGGSSAAEGIVHGENGFYCRDDAADLARVMDAALGDPTALRRIGDAARQTIPLDWSILLDRAVERYQTLIELHTLSTTADER